jgi:hypothetical protein
MMTVTISLSGTFFNFEISPILVVHAETRQSFAHFLTSLDSPLFYLIHSILTRLFQNMRHCRRGSYCCVTV